MHERVRELLYQISHLMGLTNHDQKKIIRDLPSTYYNSVKIARILLGSEEFHTSELNHSCKPRQMYFNSRYLFFTSALPYGSIFFSNLTLPLLSSMSDLCFINRYAMDFQIIISCLQIF